ncbi:MAG TPA: phosphatase PAP2 family protein [Azonexus sp.]|nr:phosphatase PAP2 family protein [Azonexus sp.]
MTRPAIAIDRQETPTAWHRQVASVFFRHIYLKGIGTTVFITLFFNLYFYLLRNPAYPITVMPFTWLDRLITVQPLAMPIYVSMWIYVSLPPALLATRRELWFYGEAIAVTCLAGLLAFYFWPTAVPVATVDWTRFPELDFLKNIDASGNACPSLHVATAVFSGVWLHHLLRRFGGPLWILAINWTWCIGIVYSTMAIRQHVALDVLGGLALGLPAAWLSLRYRAAAQGE